MINSNKIEGNSITESKQGDDEAVLAMYLEVWKKTMHRFFQCQDDSPAETNHCSSFYGKADADGKNLGNAAMR